MSAVIDEVSPTVEGWKWIDDRSWQMPDGKIFIFPPGEPQMLKRFRKVGLRQLLRSQAEVLKI